MNASTTKHHAAGAGGQRGRAGDRQFLIAGRSVRAALRRVVAREARLEDLLPGLTGLVLGNWTAVGRPPRPRQSMWLCCGPFGARQEPLQGFRQPSSSHFPVERGLSPLPAADHTPSRCKCVWSAAGSGGVGETEVAGGSIWDRFTSCRGDARWKADRSDKRAGSSGLGAGGAFRGDSKAAGGAVGGDPEGGDLGPGAAPA